MTLPRLGSIEVVVDAAGYALAHRSGVRLLAGDELDVELDRGGRVVVHVQDAEGDPLPGAMVQRQFRGGGREEQGVERRPDAAHRVDALGSTTLTRVATGRHVFRIAPPGNPTGRPFFRSNPASETTHPWIEVLVVEGETKVVRLTAGGERDSH